MKDFTPTSRLPDPTGPSFSSYRGILDPTSASKIKKSTAFAGILDPTIKTNYTSVAQAGMKWEGNNEDFKDVKEHAKQLKKDLGRSQLGE